MDNNSVEEVLESLAPLSLEEEVDRVNNLFLETFINDKTTNNGTNSDHSPFQSGNNY